MGKFGMFQKNLIDKKISCFFSEGQFLDLGMLTVNTNDEKIIDTIIQMLYDAKQYAVLNDIYLVSSKNQIQRRKCLLRFYEKQCDTLKQKISNSSKNSKEFVDLLYMMIVHTLSTPESTPSYGSDLVDLWVPIASSSDIICCASLILNNYPKKKELLRNTLIHHNNLFHLYQFIQLSTFETLDLELISYVFHSIEWQYYQIQENEHYKSKIPKEQIILMYQNLKELVMKYNREKIDTIQQNWKINGFQKSDLKLPSNPVLSLLDIAPISEEERKKILMEIHCSDEFQNELLEAFGQRKKDNSKIELLDLYYVLYVNPIQKQMQQEKEQNMISKIQSRNIEYLLQIERQLQIGQINEENIIGAICGQHVRPIFGLFSYLTNLPLEDLISIASNITFINPTMREQLLAYLKRCKTDISAYNEEMQTLDIEYVKSKLLYEKYQRREESFKTI